MGATLVTTYPSQHFDCSAVMPASCAEYPHGRSPVGALCNQSRFSLGAVAVVPVFLSLEGVETAKLMPSDAVEREEGRGAAAARPRCVAN